MSWKDQLRKATFRDVPFQVEGNDLGGGRRSVVHEYPQRDKPYVEDLGRSAREFSVQAFVIGLEYLAARDRLLAALEAAGPGTLVHPYFGTLKVSVKDFRCTENLRDGGMARFSISFHESGELEFPAGGASTGPQVRVSTETARTAAAAEFAKVFKVAGSPDFVAANSTAQLAGGLGGLSTSLLGVSAGAAQAVGALGSVQSLAGLMGNPLGLAQSLFSSFGSLYPDLVTLGGVGGSLLGVARSLMAMANRFIDPSPLPGGVYISAGRQQDYDNTVATNALLRSAAVLAAADVVSLSPLPVYDDAVAVRNDLSARLDAEAAGAGDDSFAALTDVRVQVRRDIAERSRNSARLETIVPADILPAVVIAYDLYEDAGRDGEIVDRNGIVHPGFVRQQALQVLSV